MGRRKKIGVTRKNFATVFTVAFLLKHGIETPPKRRAESAPLLRGLNQVPRQSNKYPSELELRRPNAIISRHVRHPHGNMCSCPVRDSVCALNDHASLCTMDRTHLFTTRHLPPAPTSHRLGPELDVPFRFPPDPSFKASWPVTYR